MNNHPITRFEAPSSIQHGSSLAELLDHRAIQLIGESFAHSLDREKFVAEGIQAIHGKALKARARAIANVLREALPPEDAHALAALRASWGPPLTNTKDNGLQGLFYMPHSALLGSFADTPDDELFSAALQANFELTRCFTAEFSIRPFLQARLRQTLQVLDGRIDDPNPHVRRLISEGTRPRLPWAGHLYSIREDPSLSLPLLTALRDDPDRYVTRSVANHLGDIGKDHRELLLQTCDEWLNDLDQNEILEPVAKERRWLIRHALRHPAKKRDPTALALRHRARA
jgi:3-methyladenine DNA glycosylase AlkC